MSVYVGECCAVCAHIDTSSAVCAHIHTSSKCKCAHSAFIQAVPVLDKQRPAHHPLTELLGTGW